MLVLLLIFGIYKTLKLRKFDCLLMENEEISLLNKNGVKTKMNGFIGGSTCKIDDKFILFGDSNYLKNKKILIEFLNKYGLKLIDFNGLEICDYGGVILLD